MIFINFHKKRKQFLEEISQEIEEILREMNKKEV